MFEDYMVRQQIYGALNAFCAVIIFIYSYAVFKEKKYKLSDRGILIYYSIINRKKAKLNIKKGKLPHDIRIYYLVVAFEILVLSIFVLLPSLLFNQKLGEILDTGANYFGVLLPTVLVSPLACLVIWMNPLKHLDLVTPAFPLSLIFAKLGCVAAGCCHGIEWEYGMYNHQSERPEVPIQLIESFCALLIFIFLFKYRKKAKPGTLYPLYLIMYTSSRFFTEFLRGEPNILGPLKTYHILCICGFLLGVVLYLIIVKYADNINLWFDETTYFNADERHETVVATRKKLQELMSRKKVKAVIK